jgi:hypothetical protein
MLKTPAGLVVITLGDAEWSFDGLQDLRDRDGLCVACQEISTFWSILAFNESVFGECLQYLGEKLKGDVLLLGNLLGVNESRFGHFAELHCGYVLKSHQRVVGLFGKLQHNTISLIPYARFKVSETNSISD